MSDEAQNELPKEVQKSLKESDSTMNVDLHEDRVKTFRTVGLSRMNTSWDGPDGEIVQMAQTAADVWLVKTFPDAFQIFEDLYAFVREMEVTEQGEILRDHLGQVVYRRNENGSYIEDWRGIDYGLREKFLYRLNTLLFDWEQKAAAAWADAMWAKAVYEEHFAENYKMASGRAVEDREQAARRGTAEQRMFAIYRSLLSRKADALVKSMERLGQRLKDLTV